MNTPSLSRHRMTITLLPSPKRLLYLAKTRVELGNYGEASKLLDMLIERNVSATLRKRDAACWRRKVGTVRAQITRARKAAA